LIVALSIGFAFWLAVGLILIIRGLGVLGVAHRVLAVIEGISWIAAGIIVAVTQGIP
jgi:hypothetical protein